MAFDSRLLTGIGVLVAVVEAGSFVRAADGLGLTASGVSRAIARLEQRVGVRLLHRTARAVALTDEGRRFYDEVAPLLSGIEDSATRTAGAAARVHGRLRISVDAAVASFILLPRIGRLLDHYPDLDIDIEVRDRLGDLVADGFDLSLRFADPQLPSGLIARRLSTTRVVTCATPDYIARHGRPLHPRDLEQHRCILLRDESAAGRPFGWEFQRAGETVPVQAHGRLMVNDTHSLLAGCLSGYGIAQLLDFYIRDRLADGHLVDLFPDWAEETFPLYAFFRSRSLPPAKVCAFLDFVQEEIAA